MLPAINMGERHISRILSVSAVMDSDCLATAKWTKLEKVQYFYNFFEKQRSEFYDIDSTIRRFS